MADFRLPPLSLEERLYRALLVLYPAEFRRRFGQEMVEAFRDARRDAQRHGEPRSVFWLTTLPDLATHAARERGSATWHALRQVGSPHSRGSLMASLPHALRLGELRHAARRLARVPSFTAATLLVLALGIGATTTVFSLLDAVVLRPLPYPQSERLVDLSHATSVPGVSRLDQSDATFLLYQRHARSFEGIGVSRQISVDVAPASGDGSAERVTAASISASLLGVLGVTPLLGRGLLPGEDRATATPVVILSEGLWRTRYGADRSVIGRRIDVDGTAREVVGVMPASFRYPGAGPVLWLPLPFDPAHTSAASFNYVAAARLKPGVTHDAAARELTGILPRLLEEFPTDIPRALWEQAQFRPTVSAMRDVVVGDVGRTLWILLASAALVLVVACANVANLFLVRGEARQRELVLRTALGAGLPAVLAQYVSEALLLAAGGGALGVTLALLGVRVAHGAPQVVAIPRLHEVRVGGTVLLVAVALSLLCAVVVSLLPMFRARRLPIASVLRESGRSATASAARQRTRGVLVVGQVALALVLVAASGLMARSFARLRDVRPGFDARGVATARIALPTARYRSAQAVSQFHDALLARLAALPGVRGAGLTTLLPLTSDGNTSVMEVQDRPAAPGAVARVHSWAQVSGSYFAAVGVPLLAGRTFGAQDPARATLEVVVSRAFAKRYWQDESPLGRRLRPDIRGPWYTVVGVVDDVHLTALEKPADECAYFPLVMDVGSGVEAEGELAVVLRSSGDASALAGAVRSVARELDPALPVFGERPMTQVLDAATARTRFTMLLLAVASGLALVLGAVGIYAVMAYGVSLRQREIGVRLALGARPADVRQMISRQGVALAAIGVGIGLLSAIGLMRFLRDLLYDVSPTDPLTLAGTCVVLLAVALLASWIPARRAAAVDPSEALRRD